MDNKFQYYAFISYSREDEKWAKWLQDKLENYKIPTLLKKNEAEYLPKYIRPIFRDKTNINIGELEQSLSKEIEDSRFLIVICSPKSAKSKWVNKEISKFKEIGRENRIIPFIIEGTPNPKTENQKNCYPNELNKDILGASLNELTKEQALVKIIAFILGLKFDEIWQRHKREEKRKNRIKYTLISILVPFLLFSMFWIGSYFYTTSKNYIDYVEINGIPNGLFLELNDRQIKERYAHYQINYARISFFSLKRMPISIKYVNSAGMPTDYITGEYAERAIVQNIEYGRDGNLSKIIYLDKNKQILFSKTFNGQSRNEIDFKNKVGEDELLPSSISNPNEDFFSKKSKTEKSKINHYSISRDSIGRIIKIRYKYAVDYMADANGVFGEKHKVDTLGRIREINYIDENEVNAENKIGISKKVFTYDLSGNVLSCSYLDKEGSLTLCSEGYAKWEYEYKNGNVIKVSYFDSENKLCINNFGYAIAKYEYDNRGYRTRVSLFDTKMKPTVNKEWYSSWNNEYDENGNVIKVSFFDENKIPTISKLKVAGFCKKYNNENLLIEESYFDIKGNPCLNGKGYAVWMGEYDFNGNLSTIKYLNKDGKLISFKDNIALIRKKYNSINDIEEVSFYDSDENPTINNEGYSKWTYEYDNMGNVSKVNYFDINNHKTVDKNGISYFIKKYDLQGNLVEFANYDLNGNLHLDEDSIARQTIIFDKVKNQETISYFGIDNLPTINKEDKVSKIIYKYDKYNRAAEIRNYNVNDEPCLDNYGVAIYLQSYWKDNIIETTYLNENGKTTLDKDGIGKIKFKYDDRNNQIEEAYYGTKNNVILREGVSFLANRYDQYGNETEEYYLDKNHNLCEDENGIAKILTNYDKIGNVSEIKYLNINGKLCLNEHSGFAKKVYKYDEFNNRIKVEYFGVDERPCAYKNAQYGYLDKFDKYGNNIKTIYFGFNNKPCINSDGYAISVKKYNEINKLIEICYYGTKMNRCKSKEKGFSRKVILYKKNWDIDKEVLFDINNIKIK